MTTDNDVKPSAWIWWIPIAVLVVWVASYFVLRLWFCHEQAGQFGDSFGAVNALFSGLALFGVVVAIVLQQKELGLTRKEMRAQEQQLGRQAAALNKQNFETTYFALLRTLREITMSLGKGVAATADHSAGTHLLAEIQGDLRKKANDMATSTSRLEAVVQAFRWLASTHSVFLDAYFKTTDAILGFLADHPDVDQEQYAGILWAQFSSQELLLHWYRFATDSMPSAQVRERYYQMDLVRQVDLAALCDSEDAELIPERWRPV